MKSPDSIPLFLFVLLAAAGCGQSGPLYLPGDPSEVESLPAATPAESTAEDDEEDEDTDNDDG